MSERHLSLLKKIREKAKDPNQTQTIIRKMKTEVPVLSTIVDYGGRETFEDL